MYSWLKPCKKGDSMATEGVTNESSVQAIFTEIRVREDQETLTDEGIVAVIRDSFGVTDPRSLQLLAEGYHEYTMSGLDDSGEIVRNVDLAFRNSPLKENQRSLVGLSEERRVLSQMHVMYSGDRTSTRRNTKNYDEDYRRRVDAANRDRWDRYDAVQADRALLYRP